MLQKISQARTEEYRRVGRARMLLTIGQSTLLIYSEKGQVLPTGKRLVQSRILARYANALSHICGFRHDVTETPAYARLPTQQTCGPTAQAPVQSSEARYSRPQADFSRSAQKIRCSPRHSPDPANSDVPLLQSTRRKECPCERYTRMSRFC